VVSVCLPPQSSAHITMSILTVICISQQCDWPLRLRRQGARSATPSLTSLHRFHCMALHKTKGDAAMCRVPPTHLLSFGSFRACLTVLSLARMICVAYLLSSLARWRPCMQAAVIALGVLNKHNNEEITG